MNTDREPEYELDDRLITIMDDGWTEDSPRERVIKRRFLDLDSQEFQYAIGLSKVPESFEIWSQQDLDEHYRRVTDDD